MINILIPMAGEGSRFKNTHSLPKPLISINDAKFITIDKKNADNNLEIYNFTAEEKFYFNG